MNESTIPLLKPLGRQADEAVNNPIVILKVEKGAFDQPEEDRLKEFLVDCGYRVHVLHVLPGRSIEIMEVSK